MGCKIEQVLTKSQQESTLFKELQELYGDALALEKYLDIENNKRGFEKIYGKNEQGEVNYKAGSTTPLFKFAEFDSYQQMEDVMDDLVVRVIDAVKTFGEKNLSKTTLSPISLEGLTSDPLVMPRIITTVRQQIQADIRGKDASSEEVRLLELAHDGLPGYLGSAGSLGVLGTRLSDYGLDINVQDTFIEQDAPSLEKEDWVSDAEEVSTEAEYTPHKETLYNMTIHDVNPITTVLGPLKLYLKRLPRVHKNFVTSKDDPLATPEYEMGELNKPRPVNFELLFSSLKEVLLGVQSVEHMKARLGEAIMTKPELVPLYKNLMEENSVNIKNTGEYRPLSTALMSLVKADYNFVSFINRGRGDVSIGYANSTTVQSRIKQRWADNVLIMKELPTDTKTDKRSELLSFMNAKSSKEGLNFKPKRKAKQKGQIDYTPKPYFIKEAARLLKYNGFPEVIKEDLYEVIEMVKKNPFLIHNSRTTPPPAEIVFTLLDKLPYKILTNENADIFSSTDEEFGEGKLLGLLSKAVSKRMTDVFSGAFLSGRGSVIHPMNLSSEAHDVINRLMFDGGESRNKFSNDPMYTNSKLLEIIGTETVDGANFEVQMLDVLKDNKTGKGVMYKELSSFDAVGLKMNAFFSPRKNNKYFHAFSPTLGDRGTMSMMVVPKMNVDDKGNPMRLRTSAGTIVSEEIQAWVENQLEAEITRISKAKPLVNNYSFKKDGKLVGNGHRFNLFPELNNLIDVNKLGVTKEDIEADVAKYKHLAYNEFSKVLNADIDFMIDNGLLEKDGNSLYTTKKAKKVLNKSIGTRVASKRKNLVSPSDIDTFLANNFIYAYEQQLLLEGDPAFFKYKDGNNSVQMVDMNKRFTLTQTPGIKPVVGEHTGMPKRSKITILKEGKVNSEFKDVYNIMLGSDMAYQGIELADGQGFVSLDRYKRMMLAMGIHTDELLKLLDDLQSWRPNDNHPKSMAKLAAIKNFYYKINQAKDGTMVPFCLKYAIFPAIPTIFESIDPTTKEPRFPVMNEISKRLRDGSTDEIVMESAVKVGVQNVATINDIKEGTFTPVDIDNDGLRIPQVTPTQTKVEDRAGSQIRKQIIGSLDGTSTLELGPDASKTQSVDTELALMNYHKALSLIVNVGGDAVTNNLIQDGESNTPELINKLLGNLKNNPHDNPEFYREALDMINGDTMLPLNYPSIANKLDNLVNALYRRKVNRFKLPGHSAVQITGMGMATKADNTLAVDSDLKFLRVIKKSDPNNPLEISEAKKIARIIQKNDPKDKELIEQYTMLPAEVRVTPDFFLGKLRKIAHDKVRANAKPTVNRIRKQMAKYKKSMSSSEYQRAYKARVKAALERDSEKEYTRLKKSVSDNKGHVQVDKLRASGLDNIVIYRIPTQLKNSALAVTIKEFLPEHSSNTIQVPAEVVEQAGSDFDIDKVYMEFRDFIMNEDGEFQGYDYMSGNEIDIQTVNEAKAFVMDFHRGVLTSTRYMAEVLLPNNTKTLTDISESYGYGQDYLTAPFPSATTQETFRESNQAGKQLISISSIASVMHSVYKHIGAEFVDPVIINDKPVKLGEEFNQVTLEDEKNSNKGEGVKRDRIAFELFQIQNAALDNARDPLLGKLNITQFTSPAVILMVAAGHGLKFAIDTVNSPAVRMLAKVYPTYERTMNPKDAYRAARNEVINTLGLRKLKSTHKLAQLTPALANDFRTNTSREAQLTSLNIFKELLDHGEDLGKFNRLMNFDSKGTPSSVPKLIDLHKDLSEIQGTVSNRFHINSGDKSILGELEMERHLSNLKVSEKYLDTHLADMERQSVIAPLQTNRLTSPTASTVMMRMLHRAKEELGYLDEGKQLKLVAGFNTYLAHNASAFLDGEIATDLSKRIASKEYLNLTAPTHPEATATLIDMYRKRMVSDPNFKENLFVENLSIVNKNNRRFVTFNNTVSAGMTKGLKERMMFHFEDLMYSTDPFERKLAKSIADYGIIHYGFEKSINSFVDLLPPLAHTEYMGSSDNNTEMNLPEFFRIIGEDMNDKTLFKAPEEFLTNYVKNNHHKLPIRYVDDSMMGWDADLLELENPPVYVKNVTKGITTLYKRIGFNYMNIGTRGVQNLAIEYHSNSDSDYNAGSGQSVEMTSNTSNKSAENITAEKKMGQFKSFIDVALQVGDYRTMEFTPATAEGYINRVVEYIDQNSTLAKVKQFDSTILENIKELMMESLKSTIASKARMEKKGLMFSEVFKSRFTSTVEMALDESASIYKLNEITKEC